MHENIKQKRQNEEEEEEEGITVIFVDRLANWKASKSELQILKEVFINVKTFFILTFNEKNIEEKQ